MDKFSELKAAAMAATPGRIGDRIDGSGSIKYECTGYDGSLVLRTNHKDMEYGFVGDNADADELFFRLCVPDVVLALLAELEAKDKELELEREKSRRVMSENHQQAERIAELSRLLAHNIERAESAEKRLATPVRLPDIRSDDYHETGWFQHMRYYRDVERSLRAAGFKIEGED